MERVVPLEEGVGEGVRNGGTQKRAIFVQPYEPNPRVEVVRRQVVVPARSCKFIKMTAKVFKIILSVFLTSQ